jgi:Flp pilus assembly protein TadB
MNFIGFMKKNLRDYFIIVTGINVAMAFLGMNLDTERSFGYEAFFSPLIIGAVAVLPSFVLYSTKELGLKQMIVRRGLHLLVLEFTLTVFGYLAGLFTSLAIVLPFVLTVLLVYLFTLLIRWILDSRTAQEINKGLKRLQEFE